MIDAHFDFSDADAFEQAFASLPEPDEQTLAQVERDIADERRCVYAAGWYTEVCGE